MFFTGLGRGESEVSVGLGGESLRLLGYLGLRELNVATDLRAG